MSRDRPPHDDDPDEAKTIFGGAASRPPPDNEVPTELDALRSRREEETQQPQSSGRRIRTPDLPDDNRDQQPRGPVRRRGESRGERAVPEFRVIETGLENPFTVHAAALIALASSVRASADPADLRTLRDTTLTELRTYESKLAEVTPRLAAERVDLALFVLCALIDECIMSTPWGRAGRWDSHSLLNEYFDRNTKNEVFDNLQRIMNSAPLDIELLELYYRCLSVGFFGKYGDSHGQGPHAQLREQVYAMLRSHRPEIESRIGIDATELPPNPYRIRRTPPPLLTALVSLILLAIVYAGFNVALDGPVTRLDESVTRIAVEYPSLKFAATPRQRVDFPSLLADFQGQVEIYDGQPGVRLIIKERSGMPQFRSGSAEVSAGLEQMLEDLARVLANTTRGSMIIEGHTDHLGFRVPIMTNRQLSQDRALAVAAIMTDALTNAGGNAARISSVGFGESQPLICPGNTGWQMNRRVEIRLPGHDGDGLMPWPAPRCTS